MAAAEGHPVTAARANRAPDVTLLLGNYSRTPDELWHALNDAGLSSQARQAYECIARYFLGPNEMYLQQGLPFSAGELQAAMRWPHRTTADRALKRLVGGGLLARRPNPAQRNGFFYNLAHPTAWKRPSEQSFKALLQADVAGWAVPLLRFPVGRQPRAALPRLASATVEEPERRTHTCVCARGRASSQEEKILDPSFFEEADGWWATVGGKKRNLVSLVGQLLDAHAPDWEVEFEGLSSIAPSWLQHLRAELQRIDGNTWSDNPLRRCIVRAHQHRAAGRAEEAICDVQPPGPSQTTPEGAGQQHSLVVLYDQLMADSAGTQPPAACRALVAAVRANEAVDWAELGREVTMFFERVQRARTARSFGRPGCGAAPRVPWPAAPPGPPEQLSPPSGRLPQASTAGDTAATTLLTSWQRRRQAAVASSGDGGPGAARRAELPRLLAELESFEAAVAGSTDLPLQQTYRSLVSRLRRHVDARTVPPGPLASARRLLGRLREPEAAVAIEDARSAQERDPASNADRGDCGARTREQRAPSGSIRTFRLDPTLARPSPGATAPHRAASPLPCSGSHAESRAWTTIQTLGDAARVAPRWPPTRARPPPPLAFGRRGPAL